MGKYWRVTEACSFCIEPRYRFLTQIFISHRLQLFILCVRIPHHRQMGTTGLQGPQTHPSQPIYNNSCLSLSSLFITPMSTAITRHMSTVEGSGSDTVHPYTVAT
jgi:hypothetical protein